MKIAPSAVVLSVLLFFFFTASKAPGDPYMSLIKKGNRYYRNELYGDALNYYLEGTAKNSKSPVPHFNSGAAYYMTQDYIRSIESLSEALRFTKDEEKISHIYYNLGNNYFKLGDYEKAAKHYIKGLEHNPYDLNMKYNLELALKKLSEEKPHPEENKNEDEDAKGGQKEKTGEKMNDTEGNRENQKETIPEEKSDDWEFSQQDAARLINSINTDQSRIMNEIIKKRAGSVTHEMDW